MILYIDDGNLEKIKEIMGLYPVDGVTTNPSILFKAGKEPLKLLTQIRQYIGKNKDLYTQVVSRDAEGMLNEARRIVDILGKESTYVKFPSNAQGIKAMQMAKKENIKICATAIYTVQQGLLAAQAGADCLAVYVNRIDNLGGDGVQVAKDLQEIMSSQNLPSIVAGASFKNVKQVIELAKAGIGMAAIGVDVWQSFLKNEVVDAAVEKFISDFEELAGKDATFVTVD